MMLDEGNLDTTTRRRTKRSIEPPKKEEKPKTTKASFFKGVLGSNALHLTLEWLGLVVMTGLVFGQHWWSMLASRPVLVLIALFTLYGWILPEDKKKPFRYKLAITGIWYGIVVATCLVVSQTWLTTPKGLVVKNAVISWWYSPPDSGSTTGSTRTADVSTNCPDSLTVQWRVNDIWKDALPAPEAQRMINATFFESSYRFCGSDGKVLMNPANNDAMGTMGIKLSLHQAEAEDQGLNLFDFEQHMRFAVWLRQKEGEAPWKESFDLMDSRPIEVETILAPVGSLSKEVTYGKLCWEEPSAPVTVLNESGQRFKLPAWPERQPSYPGLRVRYTTEIGTEPIPVLYKCQPIQ